MSAKPLLISLSLLLATGAAAGEKTPPPADEDMLEFLGTFETARGKAVDPFLLDDGPQKPAVSGKPVKARPLVRKQSKKEAPPHGRERADE